MFEGVFGCFSTLETKNLEKAIALFDSAQSVEWLEKVASTARITMGQNRMLMRRRAMATRRWSWAMCRVLGSWVSHHFAYAVLCRRGLTDSQD